MSSKDNLLKFLKDNNGGRGVVNGGTKIIGVNIIISSKKFDSITSDGKIQISHMAGPGEYTLFLFDIENDEMVSKIKYTTFWTNYIDFRLNGNTLKFANDQIDFIIRSI